LFASFYAIKGDTFESYSACLTLRLSHDDLKKEGMSIAYLCLPICSRFRYSGRLSCVASRLIHISASDESITPIANKIIKIAKLVEPIYSSSKIQRLRKISTDPNKRPSSAMIIFVRRNESPMTDYFQAYV
jgi:hypothetical protein